MSLIIAQVIGTFIGGGGQHLPYVLTCGLGSRGIDSYGIATRELGKGLDEDIPGCLFIELHGDQKRFVSIIKACLRLRGFLRERHINVVHVHGSGSLPLVIAASRLLWNRPQIIFTWHDSVTVLGGSWLRKRLLLSCMRRCACVSGSSREVARKLATAIRRSDIGIFHGGVAVTQCATGSQTPDPTIVWTGRIEPNKDPISLIHAISILRREGLKFKVMLLGRAMSNLVWYEDQLRELILELNLDETVSLMGYLPHSEVNNMLNNSDIAVQTSHSEGMSIALIEWMMCGLGIVATDVGDTSEAIQHEHNGLLVHPENMDELVTALRLLIVNPEYRNQLGTAARDTAMQHFSIEAMISRALEDYERLAK